MAEFRVDDRRAPCLHRGGGTGGSRLPDRSPHAIKPLVDLRPLPFTVYPSKSKQWKLLAFSTVLSAACFWLASEGQKSGWFFGGFFLLCGLVGLVQMLPNSVSLTVDEEGFRYVALFRTHRFRWAEIESFGTYVLKFKARTTVYVGFNFVPGAREQTSLMRASRRNLGYEAGLPEAYGHTPEQLAALLEAYRVRYAQDRS